ncbi:unnamed protein product [Auanema sp. JU1783]|nr:unnamed protein product [Auanema sp. JU1783]
MGSIIWLLAISLTSVWATTDRSSCFQYIECYENAQASLKNCAGGTGIALTLESKDKTLSELFNGRSQVISGCQDHLMKEIIDFDALQVLVTQDSRECFEKLPETTQQVDAKSGVCEYSPTPSRDHYGKEQYQCVVEYLADRQQCEALLNCCPDHTRCAERVNAVSLAYQQGKAKSLQIVSNLLSCVVSRDPSAHELVSKLRRQRSAVRNAGLPFLKPDLATEERIARRQSLTSTVTFSDRQQKFVQRYNEIREVLAKRIIEIAELAKLPTTASPITDERRVSIIKTLLKDADDQELAIYVSLISEGNFEKLSELEKQKLLKIEDEKGADNAIEKIGIIKSAIKKALSKKEQKTVEYAIKAQLPQGVAEDLQEEDIWNDRKEKEAVNEVLGEVLEDVDSDILFRAKKFASAVGEAIEAQKELILTKDNTFNGNGLSQQRTSSASDVPEGGKVHDFETIKDKVDAAVPAVKQTTLALTNIQPLTQARLVSSVQKPIDTLPVEEGSGDGEVEGSGTEEVKQSSEIESTVLIQDELILNRKQDGKEEEVIPDDKELVKRAHHKKDKSGSSSESNSSESEEHHKKHKKTRHHKKHGHKKGDKHHSSEGSEEGKTTSAPTTSTAATTTTASVTTTPGVTSTTNPETSTAEASKTSEGTSPSSTSSTESSTTSKPETTTVEGEIHIPSNNRAPREDENIVVEEDHENKRNIEEIIQGVNKDREEFHEKLENLKSKLAKIDAVSQDEQKAQVINEGENKISTIASTITGGITDKTIVVDASTDSESTAHPQVLPNFCSQYARCSDIAHEFENRCHQRFSEGIQTHGIEEFEIVDILSKNSLSKHEVVIKTCLYPLDKNSYNNLRQLIHVERGVRRACLDLGRNRGRLSAEDLSQCQDPRTSTESVERFLNDNKIRSEENLLTCLAQIESFRDSCNNISRCCASINPCDKYIKQSPIQNMKKEAIGTLVQRQTACEERMMETLKYIHDNLTSRRRRFYKN